MRHLITLAQIEALKRITSGPFSFIGRGYGEPCRTAYTIPDGGWEWTDCPASFWTPELSGIPVSKNT